MLADALEHLVRGVVDNPDDVTVRDKELPSRLDPRGPGPCRRPRQGDRPQWIRWHQGRLLATFEELPDRMAAEEARGILLYVRVDAGERPAGPDEFYDHQLVGLAAVDLDGRALGGHRAGARWRPPGLVTPLPDGG